MPNIGGPLILGVREWSVMIRNLQFAAQFLSQMCVSQVALFGLEFAKHRRVCLKKTASTIEQFAPQNYFFKPARRAFLGLSVPNIGVCASFLGLGAVSNDKKLTICCSISVAAESGL